MLLWCPSFGVTEETFLVTDHRRSLKGTLRYCLVSCVSKAGWAIPELLSTGSSLTYLQPWPVYSFLTQMVQKLHCSCASPAVSSKLPQLHFRLRSSCLYHKRCSKHFIPFLFPITFQYLSTVRIMKSFYVEETFMIHKFNQLYQVWCSIPSASFSTA